MTRSSGRVRGSVPGPGSPPSGPRQACRLSSARRARCTPSPGARPPPPRAPPPRWLGCGAGAGARQRTSPPRRGVRPATAGAAACLSHAHRRPSWRTSRPPAPGPRARERPPLADTAPRAGGAARCPAPAGPQRLAGALARASSRQSSTPTSPASVAQSVPGLGPRWRRVLRAAMPALPRGPRGHEGVSSGRLGPGATAAAGPCDGTAGPQSGTASLHGAGADAAGVVRRALRPASQPARAWSAHTAQARPGPCGPATGPCGGCSGEASPGGRKGPLAPWSRAWSRRACGLTGPRAAPPGDCALPPGLHGVDDRPGASRRLVLPRRLCWWDAGATPVLESTARVPDGGRGRPRPAPGTPWRRRLSSPAVAEDGMRGPRGGSAPRTGPRLAARARAMGGDPQAVWGADTCGLSLPTAIPSGHVTSGRLRRDQPRGKKASHPLLGVVCLLTTGGLIRVRRLFAAALEQTLRFAGVSCPSRSVGL